MKNNLLPILFLLLLLSSFQVALGQVQLKTTSTLSSWVSLNFNFGSIYSNVVNVRFDMDQQFW